MSGSEPAAPGDDRPVAAAAGDRTRDVVAYRALGLGDFLTAIPALRALRDAYPEHRIVLAAPIAIAPLARLSGAVDALIDTAPLAPPPAGADVAVNLHGRGPQSHRVLLAARPGRLIAFGSPVHDGPAWRDGEHEVHRWCRLLRESGIPADPTRLDLPSPATRNVGVASSIAADAGATVVHPGAASPARRWPADRWAAVARAELDAGRRVMITGSPAERPLAAAVGKAAGVPDRDVLAGRTDLLGLAQVVAHAGRVLCGDTGIAHLATAFGTPSVVLFGPTPPHEWGPPPERDRHVVLYRGGRGDPHADAPDSGLLGISVDEVLAVTCAGYHA